MVIQAHQQLVRLSRGNQVNQGTKFAESHQSTLCRIQHLKQLYVREPSQLLNATVRSFTPVIRLFLRLLAPPLICSVIF
jgi:hypothetical protein